MSRKQPLGPILLTIFIDMIGLGIVIPIVAPVLLDKDSGVLDPSISHETRNILLGVLIACYPVFQFFGAPMIGALSDKHGRKPLLSVSIFGILISYIIFAFGILYGNIYLLFLSRCLGGFSGGNIAVALSAISDLSTPETKAKNFGLMGMAFGVGFIVGPFLGGTLANPEIVSWFNDATPFFASAILSIINLGLIAVLFKETIKNRTSKPVNAFTGIANIRRIFTLKSLREVFLVVFLITFGFNFFTQFFQVYLISKFDFDQQEIGNTFGFIGLWIAITQGGIVRIVSKKFKPVQLLNITIPWMGLALWALLLPPVGWMIYLVIPFLAISQGITTPMLTALVSEQADANSQGEILGLSQSVQSVGMILPPMIAGFMSAFDVRLPLFTAGLCVLFGALALRAVRSSKPQH